MQGRTLRITPAHTAGREKEPVDEDTLTLILQVISEHSMPLVLLLAATVSVAALSGGSPDREGRMNCKRERQVALIERHKYPQNRN